MKRTHRRTLGTGFGVVAVVLALASTAYACTTWQGSLTVEGTGTSSVTAHGRNFEMAYCWYGAPTGTANMDDNVSGTIDLIVDQSSSACNSTKLPQNSYDIRWTTGTWDPNNPGVNDCMDTTDTNSNVSVDGNGDGTGSATFDPGSVGTIQVCVVNGNYGMQVPVSVV